MKEQEAKATWVSPELEEIAIAETATKGTSNNESLQMMTPAS